MEYSLAQFHPQDLLEAHHLMGSTRGPLQFYCKELSVTKLALGFDFWQSWGGFQEDS